MQHNFTQSQEPGAQYDRAKQVILNNPKDGIKSATFALERVTNTADSGFVKTDAGNLVSNAPATADEYNELVDLVDLEGNVLGEIKRGEMHQKLLLFLNSEMVYRAQKDNEPEQIDNNC